VQHDPALPSLDGFGLGKASGTRSVSLAPCGALTSRLARFASRAIFGLALLAFAAVASLYWFRSNYESRIFPAVSVGGVAVGGLSTNEARTSLQLRASAYETSRAAFTVHDQLWQPTLAELGVTVDVEASLADAWAVGREAQALERVQSAWNLLREDRDVRLSVTVDENTFNQWLDSVDADLGITPRNAELVVDSGVVSIVPELAGTVIDRSLARQRVVSSVSVLAIPSGELAVIEQQPRVHAADLAAARQRLEQALLRPVTVTFQDQSWTLDPNDLGEFFVQQIDDTKTGPAAVTLTLDRKALAKWLSKLVAADVNHDPVNAVVGWNGERAIAVKPSVDGTKIKPTTFAAAVAASFFGDHHPVEIPVAVTKPEIDGRHLDKLGITTRLAVGSSNFDGSDWGRAENIRVGANLLNGYLIPPHSLFSFNHAIGVISAEAGFVESNVVDGERIGRDIGGGICQVSTTVFRAAFRAGLPIDEWHPHRYRMRFYELDDWPLGLDASILQPEGDPFGGGDFSFWNPSDFWILMESYTDGPRVVIVLYGPDLGYKVDVTGPILGETYPPTEDLERIDEKLDPGTIIQTEYALEGVDVSFNRDVYARDGTLIDSRVFQTHFYPRGNVWTVSSDMQGESPAAMDKA
jgi:vancomycin resistance protein YoaR